MEAQQTVIQAKPVKLSIDDQEAIISHVSQIWDKGIRERKKYMDHADDCRKAYHCEVEPIESPELDWMSNICLPWAFDAAESWYAHIHSTTIPKNDKIFQVSGRTSEDHIGADVAEKYLEYCFDRNKFSSQLGQAYQQLARENHACLKVYWKLDKTVEYPWTDEPILTEMVDPMSGMPVQVQTGVKKVRVAQEKVTFNSVWVDIVKLDNFVMYPIRGNFSKTTKIEKSFKFYEDFIASAEDANYFNLDKISLEDERKPNSEATAGLMPAKEKQDKEAGLEITEAWIHRIKIKDKVYRNFIATIVNGKTVVRFQPFPPSSPDSPYVFQALRRDGDCFYGYGLNSKGLGILDAANKKFNGWVDEGLLNQHNAHKYYDDGVFNPNNVVRRPGAMIKLSREGVSDNVIPLMDDLNKNNQVLQDLAALKVEFETVTVPKVVKGMIEQNNTTATEQTYAQNNSFGKMHIDAYNINDYLIKPALALSYQAIYERAQYDDSVIEEIKLITQPHDEQGNPINELPLLPLPEIDIKVIGYQNVIRKQEQLQASAQVIGELAQTPAAKYFKWYGLAEQGFELADLDKDRLLMTQDEAKQADEAGQKAQDDQMQAEQHQQELMIQKETMQLQLQQQKQEQDFQIKMMELELRKQEIDCNCETKKEQLAQNADNAQHSAMQQERQMFIDQNEGDNDNG